MFRRGQQRQRGGSSVCVGPGDEATGKAGSKAGEDRARALIACPLDGCAATVPSDPGVAAGRARF